MSKIKTDVICVMVGHLSTTQWMIILPHQCGTSSPLRQFAVADQPTTLLKVVTRTDAYESLLSQSDLADSLNSHCSAM
jgi:hypothetical protein